MPNMRQWRMTALLILGAIGNTHAAPEWHFSGFASVGAGRFSEPALTFMDYESEWSLDSDSMLALQAIAEVTSNLTFTGQVISKGYTFDGESPYQPQVNWLFASYDISNDWRLRGGRLRTPLFLFSESLETGFSYPWVRPPVSMYAPFLEPFSNIDGMDITWFSSANGHETEISLIAGTTEGDYRGRNIQIHRSLGLMAITRLHDWKLRYSYNWNRMSLTYPDLEQPAALYHLFADIHNAPILHEVADSAMLDDQIFHYHAIGLQWERNGWQFIGERFQTRAPHRQFSFENSGWYLSLARQMGDFMPYITAGEYSSIMNPNIEDLVIQSYESVNQGENPYLDDLRSKTFEIIEAMSPSQSSVALGTRYEVSHTTALKLEAEYFHFNTNGQMTYDGSAQRPQHALATTIVFDVVF